MRKQLSKPLRVLSYPGPGREGETLQRWWAWQCRVHQVVRYWYKSMPEACAAAMEHCGESAERYT